MILVNNVIAISIASVVANRAPVQYQKGYELKAAHFYFESYYNLNFSEKIIFVNSKTLLNPQQSICHAGSLIITLEHHLLNGFL